MTIKTDRLDGFKVSDFYRLKDEFNLHPAYQRDNNVWTKRQKTLFIDSIINGYSIPSIYIESVPRPGTKRREHWSVLDGQQRLTTILEFADDKFKLSDDFIFFADRSIKVNGMTLSEIRNTYPLIARKFDTFIIPTIVVEAETTDEIEEMFERLNSSTSLNAAEARNAIGGPMRDLSNELATHEFFERKCPIKNFRYKYRELATKLITIELQLKHKGTLQDLKADTLKKVFQRSKEGIEPYTDTNLSEAIQAARSTLNKMTECFDDGDRLLGSIGSLVVYYLCFREADYDYSRDTIENFEILRKDQRRIDNEDVFITDTPESVYLRKYNERVQSSNDGVPLTQRSLILKAYLLDPNGPWARDLDFE